MAVRSAEQVRMADPSLKKGRSRLRLVAAGFAVAFCSIGLRLVDMVEWRDPASLPQAALGLPATVSPPVVERAAYAASRADIVDRNGVVLATNLRVPGVHADPSLFADKAAAARQLASI